MLATARAALLFRRRLRPSFELPLNDLGSGVVQLAPSIALGDFASSFTRATTATTIGSTGLVLKGIGSGVARSRYDPTTLEYQGYFAEGARTNICLQSEDLATTWTNSRSTESVNATTAPDGTATADKLVEDATAANTHFISQAITFTNAIHTYSHWLKAGERTWARILMNDGTTVVSSYFNLSTGAVGAQANGTGSVKAYANGWYHCMVTSTVAMAAAAGSISVLLAEADNDQTYDGDGVSGIYVWGAQVEAGSFASSYIPTTTAAVTRNADVLTYPFAGNASATAGWAYAELATLWSSNTTGAGVVAVGTAGGAANYALASGNARPSTEIAVRDGTTNVIKAGLTDMSTAVRKRASAWGGSTTVVTGDGAVVQSGSFDGDMGSTAVAIGVDGDGVGNQWFGTIKNVRIGIVKPTDAQLQAITA